MSLFLQPLVPFRLLLVSLRSPSTSSRASIFPLSSGLAPTVRHTSISHSRSDSFVLSRSFYLSLTVRPNISQFFQALEPPPGIYTSAEHLTTFPPLPYNPQPAPTVCNSFLDLHHTFHHLHSRSIFSASMSKSVRSASPIATVANGQAVGQPAGQNLTESTQGGSSLESAPSSR